MDNVERDYTTKFVELIRGLKQDLAGEALAGKQQRDSGYMNTAEAAKYLGVSQSTVNAETKSGKLGFYQPGGPGCLKRFTKEQLDNYFKRKKSKIDV